MKLVASAYPALVLFLCLGSRVLAQPADTSHTHLRAAYATQPQDYPTGKEYARPDTTVPFRWHFYHEGAIERSSDAVMRVHTDSYNLLEDKGVRTEQGSPVKWQFVSEHATAGKKSLCVEASGDAIRLRQARPSSASKASTGRRPSRSMCAAAAA